MKIGAPFIQFAVKFRDFLDSHGLNPSTFHADLRYHMGKDACSLSTVYGVFYGQRMMPLEVLSFMVERYGFKYKWRDTLPVKRIDGASVKTNQMALPGLRELQR